MLCIRIMWLCLPPGNACCDCWLEGRVCLFGFGTTAQTGNILQHSGALQYWTSVHYQETNPCRDNWKSSWPSTKNLQRWEVELCFRDSVNNPPILCLLFGSFGVSINLFCNSCIRYVSLPQVYRVVVLCFSPQHSVDTPGGVKLH